MSEQGRREALSEAFDKAGEADPNEPPPAAEPPAAPPAAEPPAAEPPAAPPAAEPPAVPPAEPPAPAQPPATPPDPNAPPADPNAQPPAQPPAQEAQAPTSWSPADREIWKDVPAQAQAAIAKREQEITQALNDSAQARQTMDQFNQLTAPYAPIFQSQGVDAMTGINSVLQTAAGLQMGTAQQRAQIVHQLIRDYGVDIAMLDNMIVGQHQQTPVDPAVQQMQNQLAQQSQYIQQQQYEQQARLNAETEQFIQANEFAGELRTVMADFMDHAIRTTGQPISLEDAYNRAVATRPDIQQILNQRQQAEQQAAQQQAAQQASVSIPQNSGHDAPPAAPASRREAIAQAIDGV